MVPRGLRGDALSPGLKRPASGSISSSKIVSRGEGLGLVATSGRFLGFLELEIKHKVRILMSARVAYWSFPGSQVSWGPSGCQGPQKSRSEEEHRKVEGQPKQSHLSRGSNLSGPQISNTQVFLTQGGHTDKRREMGGEGLERALGMSWVTWYRGSLIL